MKVKTAENYLSGAKSHLFLSTFYGTAEVVPFKTGLYPQAVRPKVPLVFCVYERTKARTTLQLNPSTSTVPAAPYGAAGICHHTFPGLRFACVHGLFSRTPSGS